MGRGRLMSRWLRPANSGTGVMYETASMRSRIQLGRNAFSAPTMGARAQEISSILHIRSDVRGGKLCQKMPFVSGLKMLEQHI